ncbi:MAG TPA: hypothetical protein PKL15_08470 [Saprospiraceae bacterium]|nr:hypothetical protein [Saprospiraceae bacterium]HNM25449.1 hypothetical protein [Saprospiraceae bacterium]
MSLFHRIFPALAPANRQGDRFTELKSEPLFSTIEKLEQRIGERFPESGLYQVCSEFRRLAGDCETLAQRLGRPIWPVRVASWVFIGLLVLMAISAIRVLISEFRFNIDDGGSLVQVAESAINELILLGLAFVFLTGYETRIKRGYALEALHRLRSIAHVVDMHQLTKDPAHLLGNFKETQSSPKRTLTRYELTRYLDYCSELLALNSKIAALFAQTMDDPVVLGAVNDQESLTQGLAAKIWQKIMILDLATDSGQ